MKIKILTVIFMLLMCVSGEAKVLHSTLPNGDESIIDTKEHFIIIDKSHRRNVAVLHAAEILNKVRDISGLKHDVVGLTIVVYPTKEDFIVQYRKIYGDAPIRFSFYYREQDTIYTFPILTPYVLAHEFTHVLLDRRNGRRLPIEVEEIIPNWVEKNIKLGW